MTRLLMTPEDAQRAYAERLRLTERNRRASEIQHRLRLRRQLRKAILETVRLEGGAQELETEFSGVIRSAERRMSGRPCC